MSLLRHNADVPAKPQGCRASLDCVGPATELRRPCTSLRNGGLCLAYLALSTAAAFLTIRLLIERPTLLHFAVALPFAVLWVGLLGWMVLSTAGTERLRMAPEGLTYTLRAGIPLRVRRIPIWRLRGVVEQEPMPGHWPGGAYGISIQTDRQPLRFARGAGAEERTWLLHVIQSTLGAAHMDDAPPEEWLQQPPRFSPPRSAPQQEELIEPDPDAWQPGESRCRTVSGRSGLKFVWKGRPEWQSLLSLTVFNIVWNGAVLVFAMDLHRQFRWTTLLLVIPLEVVGLLATATWLLLLSKPFWRFTWTLGSSDIIARHSVLGVGYTRWIPVDRISHVRIRRENRSPGRMQNPLVLRNGGDYALLLADAEGKTLATLDGLGHSEARWLGDQILRTYAGRVGKH